MKRSVNALLLLLCLSAAVCSAAALPPPAGSESDQILDSFFAASKAQRDRLNGSTASVDIRAEIPALHKAGRLSALRRISRLGRLRYEILRFEGDSSVKNEVIARYLSAESQAREAADQAMAVVPANYKFSYKGLRYVDGRRVYLFDLKPRQKREGLFRGSVWIDAVNYLPVREAGRLVKSPSLFIKGIQFTREYEVQQGLAVLTRLETTVNTRVVGPARITVHYADYQFEPSPERVGLITTDSQ